MYMYVYVCVHIDKYIYIYIHAYTYTYTYTYMSSPRSGCPWMSRRRSSCTLCATCTQRRPGPSTCRAAFAAVIADSDAFASSPKGFMQHVTCSANDWESDQGRSNVRNRLKARNKQFAT